MIVPTYERPRELRLVLEGLRRQRATDFEVIVADDGSGPETRGMIDAVRRDFPVPLHHVRHDDDGFRAAAIRNRAIERSSGETLVFIDGDCVPFPGFLEAHRAAREPGRYITGQRMRLDEPRSAALTTSRVRRGHLAALAPPTERAREAGEIFRAAVHRLKRKRGRPKLLTCNASVDRADVLAINGFDERFVGWGGEDDDFGRRLRRIGLRPKSVIGRARLLHLYHPPVPSFRGKVRLGPNYDYLHRGYFLTRCRNGIARRSIRDLSIHFLNPPEGVASPSTGGPCEVEVVFSPAGGWAGFGPKAEIRCLVITGPDPSPRLVKECHCSVRLDEPDAPAPGAMADAILDSLDPLI